MSSGTNQERIEQNNLKLTQLKTKADNLPEYQNVTPIYGALDYSSKTFSVQSIPANRYPSVIAIGKILIYAGYQKAMYVYYDGEYIGQYTSTLDNNNHYVAIVYHDDTEFVFVVNKDYPSTGSTSNYEGAIVNIVNKTITPITSVSTLFAGYAMQTDGETCIISSNNRLCRYNRDTNTFKYYNVDLQGTYPYMTHPSTATYQFAIYRADSNHGGGRISRFRYNKSSDSYTISYANMNNIDGISFYGNKIFTNGNVYTLNDNLTVGGLIKSDVYVPTATGSNYNKVFYWINETYMIFNGYLYQWDDGTNTLTRYIGMQYSFLGGYTISGTTVTQYTFNHSDEKIGYIVDDIPMYLSAQPTNATSSDVLVGKSVYTSGASRLVGTMVNNGQLSFTPSSSQQSIPAGYTSGGTIGAVDITTLSDYITCEGIADAILEGTTVPPVEGYSIYYKGNSLVDLSGNNKDGSLSGSYTVAEDELIFAGGYGTTGDINSARGTWEIYCKVNSNFTPVSSSSWYTCSCIMGCELPQAVQDFGIIINSSGYLAIGYSMSSIQATSIKINDGNYHHLVITTTNSDLSLYVDGEFITAASYSMSGTIPSKYGIFWNKDSSTSAVRGSFKLFRYYPVVLTGSQINQNYNNARSI